MMQPNWGNPQQMLPAQNGGMAGFPAPGGMPQQMLPGSNAAALAAQNAAGGMRPNQYAGGAYAAVDPLGWQRATGPAVTQANGQPFNTQNLGMAPQPRMQIPSVPGSAYPGGQLPNPYSGGQPLRASPWGQSSPYQQQLGPTPGLALPRMGIQPVRPGNVQAQGIGPQSTQNELMARILQGRAG